MEELAKSLNVDKWYKALILTGGLLVFISLTIETKWLTNQEAGLLGFGLIFLGVGIWRSMKLQVEQASVGNSIGIAKITTFAPDGIDWVAFAVSAGCLARFGYVVVESM